MEDTFKRFYDDCCHEKNEGYQDRPVKGLRLEWSILVSFILLISTIVIDPLEKIFHVTKLDLSQWTVVLIGSFAMIVIVEIVKFIQRKLGMDRNAI